MSPPSASAATTAARPASSDHSRTSILSSMSAGVIATVVAVKRSTSGRRFCANAMLAAASAPAAMSALRSTALFDIAVRPHREDRLPSGSRLVVGLRGDPLARFERGDLVDVLGRDLDAEHDVSVLLGDELHRHAHSIEARLVAGLERPDARAVRDARP